jgi:hypothetical protein
MAKECLADKVIRALLILHLYSPAIHSSANQLPYYFESVSLLALRLEFSLNTAACYFRRR